MEKAARRPPHVSLHGGGQALNSSVRGKCEQVNGGDDDGNEETPVLANLNNDCNARKKPLLRVANITIHAKCQ